MARGNTIFPSLCLLAVAALFVPRQGLAQPLSLKDYGEKKPGPGTSFIQSMAQDADGYVWVVASEGVYRWDGAQFHTYPEVNETGSGWFAVRFDFKGDVWIFAPDHVMRYTGTHFASIPVEGMGRIESPNAVAANPKGGWTIGTRTGVQVLSPLDDEKWIARPAEFSATGQPASGKRVPFVSRSRANSQALWFHCEQAICHWDGKGIETFDESRGVPQSLWVALLEQEDGTTWARSATSLLKRAPGASRFTTVVEYAAQVTSIAVLVPYGRADVGVTTSSGFSIYHADGSPPLVLSSQAGLAVNGSTNGLVDRENSLWIAQAGAGLVRIIGGGSWTKFPGINGVAFDRIEVVQDDGQGGVWLGSGHKLIRVRRAGKGWTMEQKQLPTESEVNGLARDPNGRVWIGSLMGTLMRLDPGAEAASIIPIRGQRKANIHHLMIDSSRRLWLARSLDVLRIDPPYDRATPVIAARSTWISECPGGEFWVGAGTNEDRKRPTLYRIKDGLIQGFGIENGLLEGPVRSVACAPNGEHAVTYWHALGWSRVKWDGSNLAIKHFKPIASAPIMAAFDSLGRLWLSSDKGMSVQANGRWTHMDHDTGLAWDNMVSDIVFDSGGAMWVAASLGLLRYQAPQTIDELPRVKPQISAMNSTMTRLNPSGGGEAEPDADVTIHFTGDSRRGEDRTVFRYRIPQISSQWRDTEDHVARFPQLKYGNYRFEVQARDRYEKWDGTQSTASVTFSVRRHWYETWWFRIPLIAILVWAAIFAVQFRTRVLRWRHKELVRAVQERTASLQEEKQKTEEALEAAEQLKAELRELSARRDTILEDERKRISREIHDELGQLLTGLRLRLAFLQQKSGDGQDEHLTDLMQQTDTTIQTVRRIASELRPPVLDHFGLSAAIEWQLGEFAKRAGIKANCSVLEDFRPDPRLSITVFRILQEALTNIGRHAQAKHVDVLLGIEDRELVLQVEDDGRGITIEQTQGKRSIGLLGMSERATAVGGSVDVKPQLEGGTIVEARFPLDDATLEAVKSRKVAS